MERKVLIFGLALGIILAGNAVYLTGLIYHNPEFKSNDAIGYSAMIVVFSITFFGIRNYRDQYLNGVISFGKAFKIGALIGWLGATIYVVFGLVYIFLFVPDFLDKYILHVLDEAAANGATAKELATKTKEMAQFKQIYKNPLFAILISYAEVLPIGLIVVLVSALFLQRKNKTTINI
jgi:uncharacterized membrane protein YfcA